MTSPPGVTPNLPSVEESADEAEPVAGSDAAVAGSDAVAGDQKPRGARHRAASDTRKPARGRLRRIADSSYLSVVAATLLFAAVCVGFILTTPTLIGPDELFHYDRVIAAEHGLIFPGPGSINTATGARETEGAYVFSRMRRGGPSQAEFTPIKRDERPSFNALGGNARSKDRDVANYETQHPPLYYALMGGLVRLWPGADAMAADKLVLLMRAFDVLMLLPLPYLFFITARRLLADNPASQAAAFLPLLVPGLARDAATINNDNLGILIGAAIVALSVRILTGDRSLRTAVLVSLCCTAGALTKITVLFMLPIVPLAYLVQAWRARSLPSRGVGLTLLIGAMASASFWVFNRINYGTFLPNAWGDQLGRSQGAPRPPGLAVDNHEFLRIARRAPSRFWASLGLHEPPQLPNTMIVSLTVCLGLFCILAIMVMRGRRLQMAVLIAVPAAAQVIVLAWAYLHFRHYLAIPGIQGRYIYPGMFGLLLPFALVAAVLLGRWSRWAPLLVCALGLLVSGWALYVTAEYTWLHRGERLVPSNWSRAFNELAEFFPLARPFTLSFAVLGAVLVVVGVAIATVSCKRKPRVFGWRELRQTNDEPTLEPALAG